MVWKGQMAYMKIRMESSNQRELGGGKHSDRRGMSEQAGL